MKIGNNRYSVVKPVTRPSPPRPIGLEVTMLDGGNRLVVLTFDLTTACDKIEAEVRRNMDLLAPGGDNKRSGWWTEFALGALANEVKTKIGPTGWLIHDWHYKRCEGEKRLLRDGDPPCSN